MKRRSFFALVLAAIAGPVWAQPPEKRYRIAVIGSGGPAEQVAAPAIYSLAWRAFFKEMARRGYVEGENLLIERYSAEGRGADHQAELARAIVATRPDIILPLGSWLALHFKSATATIPILFSAADPIAYGLVDNLAKPGGNITGVTLDTGIEFYLKSLDYLRLVTPQPSRIAYLTTRHAWESDVFAPIREAVQRIGFIFIPVLLDLPFDEAELRRAFAQMEHEHIDGLVVGYGGYGSLIVAWANEKRIPAIYSDGRVPQRMGGLMSFNADPAETLSHLARQVDMVLKGTNPGDIPIYQPSKFRLLINLATAKTIGIDIPPALLAMATVIFE